MAIAETFVNQYDRLRFKLKADMTIIGIEKSRAIVLRGMDNQKI